MEAAAVITPDDTPTEIDTPALKASMHEGKAHAIMIGCGETFVPAFGIFLGATTVQVGLIATLPLLAAALAQNASVLVLEKYPYRKKIIEWSAAANAMVWIPIALLALFGPRTWESAAILLSLFCVYHFAGGLCAPAWNSVMSQLVPKLRRGEYFGRRNRWGSFFTFVAMFAAGRILWLADEWDRDQLGYTLIFLLAFLARLVSVRLLKELEDPGYSVKHEHRFTFIQFVRALPRSNFARFVFFSGLINFGVAFAAPYFSLYMLRDLKFTYSQFTVLTAVMMASQFITMQHWGKFIDQFGNKKILNICGAGVCIAPFLWLLSSEFEYLMLVQLYSGFIWAGYNLATANFIFDAVSVPKLPRCIAYHALVNSIFFVLGSLAGGYTANHIGELLAYFEISHWVSSPLLIVFALSGLIRAGVVRMLIRRFKEVRDVPVIRNRELVFRIVDLRPIAGATFQVVTKLARPGR